MEKTSNLLCNVIMLPSKNEIKEGDLILIKHDNRLPLLHTASELADGIAKETGNIVGQHLYFTSDDEIREGDWFIGETNIVKRVNKISKTYAQIHTADGYAYFRSKSKKIVATTDTSIAKNTNGVSVNKATSIFSIGHIRQSFIKAYVEAEGNIKTVMVECELIHEPFPKDTVGKEYTNEYRVKTNSDNMINIWIPQHNGSKASAHSNGSLNGIETKGRWFFYWKKVQGTITSSDYIFISEEKFKDYGYENEKTHLSACESWAEKVDSSGSNYGFEYGFDDIDSPPQEWIDKKILSTQKEIQNKMDYVNFLKTVNQVK